VAFEALELEDEAVADPLLLLPQAARIPVAATKRKEIVGDSDVRIDIFFGSFSSSLVT
jgi:hypothetical protein